MVARRVTFTVGRDVAARKRVGKMTNRGVDMTLAEYAAKYNVLVTDHKSGAKYVVGPSEVSKWELFHLSDYAVTSVSGPTHWLVKRNPYFPGKDEPNVICAWCKKPLRYDPEIPKGQLSHGICLECAAEFNDELDMKDNPSLRKAGALVNDYPSAKAFLRGKQQRELAHNTDVVDDGDRISIRLYGTRVVTYYSDGSFSVSHGGYKTLTTRRRLTTFIPVGWRLASTRKGWVMICASDGHEHEFRNGMRCMPDGSVDYKGAGMSRDEIAALHHNPLLGVLGNPGRGRMSKSRAIRFILALNGMSERKVTARLTRDGEIRVNLSGGDEATAYYTSDPQDAINTAQQMQREYAMRRRGESIGTGDLAEEYARSGHKRLLSNNVTEVRYIHAQDSKAYSHKFASGVRMYALADGAIMLAHNTKKLWEDFK